MQDPSGRFIVLYTFIARDENDVSVERGEFVTVLNREDPDWYWIVRTDGQEGFIPSAFVYPAELMIGTSARSVFCLILYPRTVERSLSEATFLDRAFLVVFNPLCCLQL